MGLLLGVLESAKVMLYGSVMRYIWYNIVYLRVHRIGHLDMHLGSINILSS